MKWNFKIISNKESEQAAQELKILEEDIATARDFFRKNCQTYFQGKKKIPIYLILGPSSFGKTTLLSQAGLDLIDADQQALNNVTPTKYCSFWFTKDSLYIDTAGTYTKPDIIRPRNDLIWQGFIKLLQKYFGKHSIAGTLIILDLPAIAEDKILLKKTLFCVRERIYEMTPLVKRLPTHIIFTKCDKVLGFTEFFSMLSSEERLQPFGIRFNKNKKTGLIPAFETKFNLLLKHLNNRIVENLQKSIRLQDRPLIKIFPSQIEYLRHTFIETISKIPHSRQILLSGIYFTSSIQSGQPLNLMKNALFHALNLQEKPRHNLELHNNRSYFVEKLFKKTIILPPQRPKFTISWTQTNYACAFLIASLIISTSSIFGFKSYSKNAAVINQIKPILRTQNVDTLYTAINQLQQSPSSIWLTLGINKIKKLRRSLVKTHQVLLAQTLASQLANYLAKLNIQEPNNPKKLYRGLQIYLMFGDPEKLDPTYIKIWLNNNGQEIYGANENIKLQKQLDTIFQHKFKIALDQQLITKLRENLNNLPSTQLIYLLLENTFAQPHLEADLTKSISQMYLRKNFHRIYDDALPNLGKNPPKYDWVSGKLGIKTTTAQDITKNLQDLYLKKYVTAWKNTIKLEKKTEFKNWAEITKYLNTIATTNSLLISTLKQVQYNINIDNPPPQLITEINKQLPQLNDLNLEELQNKLNNLTQYIKKIETDSKNNEVALITLKQYLQDNTIENPLTTFKTFVDTQPLWLQTYLQSVINDIWRILIDTAHDDINQAWNQTIMPKYRATLANKFPLFKESKNDIRLEDFDNFFGPNGLMDNFFNKYLKPLVNTDKTHWTWKEINGQEIDYSPILLEIFLRAALIQKMFYPAKTTHPELKFVLTPIAMTPNTKSFTLHIDGQKIFFANKKSKMRRLVWPGPKPGLVTMSFVNNQDKYFTSSEFGPWAWFRALDKANVTSSNNTRYFELNFDLNGNAVKYSLSTVEPVNPFIPEIINNFRCTEQSS